MWHGINQLHRPRRVVCLAESGQLPSVCFPSPTTRPTAIPASPTTHTSTFQQLLSRLALAFRFLSRRQTWHCCSACADPHLACRAEQHWHYPARPQPSLPCVHMHIEFAARGSITKRSGGPSRPILASGWSWPAIGHNLKDLPNGIPKPNPFVQSLLFRTVAVCVFFPAVWASPCSLDPNHHTVVRRQLFLTTTIQIPSPEPTLPPHQTPYHGQGPEVGILRNLPSLSRS